MKQRKPIAILAMILVLVLSIGVFAACDNGKKPTTTTLKFTGDSTKYCLDSVEGGSSSDGGGSLSVTMDYTLANNEDHSDDSYYEKYSSALGEFYKAYVAACAQTDTDARYAAMAIAEAKLLQSGTYIPTSSQGGSLGISRVAPYTISNALWGNDSDRYHNAVLTTDFISAADREEMKAKYAELKGTGTYEAWAKSFLTGKGYTLKDTYTIAYSADPKTWDILNTYRSADAEAIVNTFDNLVEYDGEGRLMSALATGYSVSEDKLTYTFKIRENVMWVDQDGRPRYEVTAQDWVDGLERALTTGATSYLVEGIIKNASEFASGEITDFSMVGVRAVDKYTLEYTLEEPCSYFISMFIYNPLAPFCKSYADSVGDKYGTGPEYILYCGPYIVTNYTKDNKIVFSANPYYWAYDSINVKTLTWLSYAENKDVTKTYNDALSGTIDSAALNSTTLPLARANAKCKEDIYVSGTDATAYGFYVNINRTAFSTDGYSIDSTQTDAQKSVTNAAFNSESFRMALARAIDKETYNAPVKGADAALYNLNNMYTTGTFVSLGKDITIDINGTSTTFPKGTYYGAIVQAQINADMGEYAIKVWDATADNGIGSSSGFDGWYSESAAKHYFELACEELAAKGITVSKDNPIVIDYPYYEYSTYTARAYALKQQVEKVFDGKVVLNLVSSEDIYGWYYAGYYAETGTECNYDIYDCSGWGPDYKDPSSFLNTMLPGGDMIKMLGIY